MDQTRRDQSPHVIDIGWAKVLVATDAVLRGLDINNVQCITNYEHWEIWDPGDNETTVAHREEARADMARHGSCTWKTDGNNGQIGLLYLWTVAYFGRDLGGWGALVLGVGPGV